MQGREPEKAHPPDVQALLERAGDLRTRYQIPQACELFEAALQMAGDDPAIASRIAHGYASAYRFSEAIRCLEAIPADRLGAEQLAELAVNYEQIGRYSEAEAAIARCLAAVPRQPEPRLIQARLLAQRGESSKAQAVLVELLQRPDIRSQPPLAVRALYQLGAALDRLGDYDGAVAAVTQAKAIQKTHPDAERLAKAAFSYGSDLAAMYKRIDVKTLARWAAERLSPLPSGVRPAHLVGFPRSGTTLLEQLIDAHPDLTASSERMIFPREILPQLVNRDGADSFEALDGITHDKLCELRTRYIEYFGATHRQGITGRVHLDKEPANLQFLFGLLRLLPESKFVVALRDPRDVIVSNFLRFVPERGTSVTFLSWRSTCVIYGQCMEIWLYIRELMRANSWLEVRYEDVCDDAEKQASRVLEFLGLDPEKRVTDHEATMQDKHVHSPSAADVRKPVHRQSIGRWKHYEKHLRPLLDILKPITEALGYN